MDDILKEGDVRGLHSVLNEVAQARIDGSLNHNKQRAEMEAKLALERDRDIKLTRTVELLSLIEGHLSADRRE